MEMQDVLHTDRILAGKYTYYFDLKQSEKGYNYLNITQTIKDENTGEFERQRITLFERELRQFGPLLTEMMLRFQAKKQTRLSEEEIAELRKEYPNAFVPWTTEDDDELRQMVEAGQAIEDIASYFQRKPSAINYRLRKLKVAS